MEVSLRPVGLDDAGRLAALLRRNRAALAGWDPVRPESYFTQAGQRAVLAEALERSERQEAYPALILVDGRCAGRINLNNVVFGPFRSADLGYWVGTGHRGRGVATAAVGQMLRTGFEEVGLHRVQAATLLHNTASRRVLARHGFTEIGIAPRYLQIAGRWQDHLLHQRLADDLPLDPA